MTQKGAEAQVAVWRQRGGRTISRGDLAEGPDLDPSRHWEPHAALLGALGAGLGTGTGCLGTLVLLSQREQGHGVGTGAGWGLLGRHGPVPINTG